MTLGELIKTLEQQPAVRKIARGLGHPHSYRGYYDELAFERVSETTVGAMLESAKSALGETFHGWKGGEYTMDAMTPVWLAERGRTGERLTPLILDYLLNDDRPWT